MDLTLTILFYVYAWLALAAPLFVIPSVVICRRRSTSAWRAIVVGIPWFGLPLFALMIRLSERSAPRPLTIDRD